MCALISSLFLEIHKVFLQKSAIIRTHIFSGFALAELCGVALISFILIRVSTLTRFLSHIRGTTQTFLPVEITAVDGDQTEKLVIIRLFRQHRFRRNRVRRLEHLPPVSVPFRLFLSRLSCWAEAQQRSLGAKIARKLSAHRCFAVFTEQNWA